MKRLFILSIISFFLLVSSVNGMMLYSQSLQEQEYQQSYQYVYEHRIENLNQTDDYYVIDYDFLLMTRDNYNDPSIVMTAYNPIKQYTITHKITYDQFAQGNIALGGIVNLTAMNYTGVW